MKKTTGSGPNPSGLCMCGCGGIAPLSTHGDNRRGIVFGKPVCYINGHQLREVRTKHGLSHTPEYAAFWMARERCTNSKHKQYKDYGGRGIEFKFPDFESFLAEVGPRPSSKYSIDRLNNDGHYEVGNLAWRTRSQQQRNRRPGIREKNRSSKYLGVHWDAQRRRWFAQCSIDRKRIAIGRFKNQETAARARDSFVVAYAPAGSYILNFTQVSSDTSKKVGRLLSVSKSKPKEEKVA